MPVKPTKSKIKIAIWQIVAGLLLATGVTLVLSEAWPYNGLVVSDDPVIVGPSVVPVGGTVEWKRSSICNNGYDIITERWAVSTKVADEETRLVADRFEMGAVGFDVFGSNCIEPAFTKIILPQYIPPGEYRIEFTSIYKPNLLTEREVVSYSPVFTIVPNN